MEQAARAEASRLAQQLPPHLPLSPDLYFEDDDPDRLSNRVVNLIDEGRLEEAQAACQVLKDQHPDVIDWLMRTAMLHEARGETQLAMGYCERTLAYMDSHPEDFEPASREPFKADIARLQRSMDESN